MITFVGGGGGGGSKFAKGGPNPLANMDSRGYISASGFGPGGYISASGFGPGDRYPLADLDRGVQIR